MHYEYIFCILVYKNTEDIIECLHSIKQKVDNYRVVIVNSFFDASTEKAINDIAYANNCDFLSIENKGYGYGNNRGIEYIKSRYTYDFLIISNPDIEIVKFEKKMLRSTSSVYAPLIRNKMGKNQNPYWYKKNRIAEEILYLGLKNRRMMLYYVGVAVNKLIREFLLRLFILNKNKKEDEIYAAHGSFLIVGSKVIEQFNELYDDNMFLFAEEAYLAHIFEVNGIDTFLIKDIVISHKEDGSVGLANIDEMKIQRESFLYYYEKYIK